MKRRKRKERRKGAKRKVGSHKGRKRKKET